MVVSFGITGLDAARFEDRLDGRPCQSLWIHREGGAPTQHLPPNFGDDQMPELESDLRVRRIHLPDLGGHGPSLPFLALLRLALPCLVSIGPCTHRTKTRCGGGAMARVSLVGLPAIPATRVLLTLQPFMPSDLPAGLEALREFALDLRWTWSHGGDELWRALDAEAWEATENPWLILQGVSRARLEQVAGDPEFRRTLARLGDERRMQMEAAASNAAEQPGPPRPTVAFFSMEFGFGAALPLYAGGLGILAADYLKAASDLGMPIAGVGLLYQEGYFRQLVDADGRQEELYPYNDPTALPIQPQMAEGGGWLRVPLELPGRTVRLRVWRAAVGQAVLFLLDSNDPLNAPADRGITGKLYDSGDEHRLRQEIVLGIGGHRVLEALNLPIGVCHLNEGHAAFVVLERARIFMRRTGQGFEAALWATRAGNVFTTHTPVQAGFDAFDPALIAKYFPDGRGYLGELGLPLDGLLALGRVRADDAAEPFRPAYLAVRGAAHVNAVSALHGEVTRRLFQPLFPRWPEREVPVVHVTNGVHTPTWDSRWADLLWTKACGKDRWRRRTESLEPGVRSLSDEEILAAARQCPQRSGPIRARRVARQLAQRGSRRTWSAGHRSRWIRMC